MKIIVLLMFLLTLHLSACVKPLQVQAKSKTSAALSNAEHNYQCQSGEKIVVNYQSIEAIFLQYQGSHYKMSAAVSASGSRYITNDIEWWTKGSGAGAKVTGLQVKLSNLVLSTQYDGLKANFGKI